MRALEKDISPPLSLFQTASSSLALNQTKPKVHLSALPVPISTPSLLIPIFPAVRRTEEQLSRQRRLRQQQQRRRQQQLQQRRQRHQRHQQEPSEYTSLEVLAEEEEGEVENVEEEEEDSSSEGGPERGQGRHQRSLERTVVLVSLFMNNAVGTTSD